MPALPVDLRSQARSLVIAVPTKLGDIPVEKFQSIGGGQWHARRIRDRISIVPSRVRVIGIHEAG
jgi:hypothetical protein